MSAMAVAEVAVSLRVRVLGVDVVSSTATGSPGGEPWGTLHPDRRPRVTWRVDDPLDLVTQLASGDDLTVDVEPENVLTWTRPAI